ncbi:PepSY-associated TM helix domain-containing protein [Aquisalimonas lutea]|uniref:PepSY-associated TM helix domain-containing protein n=1 Tax=Aquisalimonas lutea TaxID=1327750 RepID=UPI0025B54EF4|nr:PepSY-associated TM helix domain-containing protein [Aquisalimonas lutea]MDN3516777.1 PepSY-associated TM helix domain-containing protein [Aquisalimonas lutea]
MRFRRHVYLLHRYLGIALCLLMAMWFASGMVLMYVGYPSLDEQRRLAGLPSLEPGPFLPPARVLARHPDADALRLNASPGRPVYIVREHGERHVLDAATGDVLSPDDAWRSAAAERHAGARVLELEPVRVDQWTVSGRLDSHRPLWRARMDDADGTWLYLSSQTGEVVQEATRLERAWNWVGAVVHWIYPWQLRQHPELWRQVVIWLCVPALALIATGALVGIWRLRVRRRYKGNRMTPYRGWQRWHHVLGIACVTFVFTFMVSGLLSMNPGRIFTSPAPPPEQRGAWKGGPLVTASAVPPDELPLNGVRELEWQRQAGTSLVLLHRPDATRVLRADGRPADFGRRELVRRADALLPEADVTGVRRLDDYDAYYYARRGARPLPVLRVRFDDPGATALYIDPETAVIEARMDTRGRWRRWLYNGLHSLDFAVLWQRRPLWDVVVLGLCLAGLAFSVTGVVIGWRRLTRRTGIGRRRRPPVPG